MDLELIPDHSQARALENEMSHPGSITEPRSIERVIRAMGGIWEPMDDGGKYPNVLTMSPKGEKVKAVINATMGMVRAAVSETVQVRTRVRQKQERLAQLRAAYFRMLKDSNSVDSNERYRRRSVRNRQLTELRLSRPGARDEVGEGEDWWRWERDMLAGRISVARLAGGDSHLQDIRGWYRLSIQKASKPTAEENKDAREQANSKKEEERRAREETRRQEKASRKRWDREQFNRRKRKAVADSATYYSNVSSKGKEAERRRIAEQRKRTRVTTVKGRGGVNCNSLSDSDSDQSPPIHVEPPMVGSASNSKKRARPVYLMTGPQSKKSRACRLALESGPASVGAGISVGAFRVSHVSCQSADDATTVRVVEEGLAAYQGAYTAKREASSSAARLSAIL